MDRSLCKEDVRTAVLKVLHALYVHAVFVRVQVGEMYVLATEARATEESLCTIVIFHFNCEGKH